MPRCLPAVALLCLASLAHAEYWPQNDPRSGGMRDLMLLYIGDSFLTRHHYRAADLLPYVAYLDKRAGGKPRDWFYDCYLFLTIFGAPSKAKYDDGPTNLADWRFYLDVLFDRELNLHALDEAIGQAAQTLGPPPRPVPVMLMMPYMSPEQHSFGDVDGSGRALDLGKLEDAVRCTEWFVAEVKRRFAEGHFQHLSLWGLYWMKEGIPPGDEELTRAAARVVHGQGLGLHWIPYALAPGVEKWRELGLDFAILQPNYACAEDHYRTRDEEMFTRTAERARKAGLGIEIEVPYRTIYGSGDREGLYDYLNHGLPVYEGYMSAVHGYYQTIVDIGRMYSSDVPADNRLYDALYAFAKQTYREHPACVSDGAPCVLHLPGLSPVGTLALTRALPAAESEAVAIPGSGGVLTVTFPTARRVRKVLLHVRSEGPGAEGIAFVTAGMADDSGEAPRVIGTLSSPATAADGGWHWWRIIGPPQVGESLVVQFSGPLGGRLRVDQVRAIGVAEPGMDATCTTDGVGDGQGLTDREYASGTQDASRLVTWATGRGTLTVALPDDRHIGTLWFHAVKPPNGQWPARVEVVCGARRSVADLPTPADAWATYFPVSLPLVLADRVQVTLVGAEAGRPVALDEVELDVAPNLARGKSYTFEPQSPPVASGWNYPDDGKKLTDGEFAEAFLDHKLAGWLGTQPQIIVDLGQPQAVSRVRIHAWGGGLADTYFPTAITVWVSADGQQWQPLLRRIAPPAEPPGAKVIAKAWLETALNAAGTRYVRLDFVPHSFLLIDEIEVMVGGANVARGRPYRVEGPQPRPAAGQYPDDGRRMTDGEVSFGFWDRVKVAGSGASDPVVTVDLERAEEIVLAAAHVAGGGSGGVYYPAALSVQTSLDGTTWTEPVTSTQHPPEPAQPLGIPFASPESRERTVGLMETPLQATARFVRFQLRRHGFCMVDEVEVYGPAGR